MAKILENLIIKNRWIWIIILFSIILVPNIFVILFSSDLADSITMKIAYIALSLIMILFPLLFLKAKYYFLLYSPFVLFAPIEIAHILLNKMPLTQGFVEAIVQTNYTEAIEVLFSFKEIVILIGCIWILYFYAITRIENKYLFTIKAKFIFIIGVLVFNIALYVSMWKLSDNNSSFKTHINDANGIFLKKYTKVFPSDLCYAVINTIKLNSEIQQMDKAIHNFHFHAKQISPIKQKQIYVLVIGESARYGEFSINNYKKETSPNLKETEGLISYSNVYSAANLTSNALPFILTRATPHNNEISKKEKSVLEAFKECGFYTSWIGNQSATNHFIKRIANNADYNYFSVVDFDASTNFDGNLIPHFEKILKSNRKKIFIVIHTLGSHFRYNFRYPDKFKKFSPCLEGTCSYSLINKKNKDLLVNTYDNSILYTDYVLSEIIRKLEKVNAISSLVYVSDHAENLYDNNDLILHGQAIPTIQEIHIPLFIWTSNKYKHFFSKKQIEIEKNKNKKISSTNLFHSILDMADINYPTEIINKSFTSPLFIEESVRYVLTPEQKIVSFK